MTVVITTVSIYFIMVAAQLVAAQLDMQPLQLQQCQLSLEHSCCLLIHRFHHSVVLSLVLCLSLIHLQQHQHMLMLRIFQLMQQLLRLKLLRLFYSLYFSDYVIISELTSLMGDFLQYLCSLEYYYEIQVNKISNHTYRCLLYNKQSVFTGRVGSKFSSGGGDHQSQRSAIS